ncbi:hypothetical protein [Pseudomonas sp.]|uniref:hypothetical protein n=1 Tax=Pseudomonas sp. TaxID=306 RepID=UPI003CC5E847
MAETDFSHTQRRLAKQFQKGNQAHDRSLPHPRLAPTIPARPHPGEKLNPPPRFGVFCIDQFETGFRGQ